MAIEILRTSCHTANYAETNLEAIERIADERGLEIHAYCTNMVCKTDGRVTLVFVPEGTPRAAQARYQNMALASYEMSGAMGYVAGGEIESALESVAEQLDSVAICA